MPRNPEEKKDCQEKFSQMQKYLPFLDFMIDKIEKKNDASLECQLNKFQVLKSMIAEKNQNYALDALIKVEQIIEKLISKLDYKEDVEKSKGSLEAKDIKGTKVKMSASVPLAPSKNIGDSKVRTHGASECQSQNVSSSSVGIRKKSLEMLAGINDNKKIDKDTVQSPEEKSKCDVSGKILGTDLDKDLDGFDLTDCTSASEGSSKSSFKSYSAGPEKPSFQGDLLSSSREKLLKSLQNRLFPNRIEHTSSNFLSSRKNSSDIGEASVKSSDQNSGCEIKRGSLEINERSGSSGFSTKNKIFEKPNTVSPRTAKSLGLLEKQRNDADSSEINLKQKLKEKFSTVICEVYRVPGKSVGGSLRCLKDSKDRRRGNFSGEEELFKPDVLTKVNVPSRGSSSSLPQSEAKDKCRQDSKIGELKIEKSSDKTCQNFSASVKNKQAHRQFKLSEFKNTKSYVSLDKKSSSKSDKKDVNKLSEREEKTEMEYDMNKLNDEELTEFVKENIQHLPHLAKLKPSELRKTVESTFVERPIHSDAEFISDDSLEEFDEFLTNTNQPPNELKSPTSKSKNKERHPLASLKIAEVGADSSPKSKKPSVALSADLKVLEGDADKIDDTVALPSVQPVDEEEDYAIKLIEETTPKNAAPLRKKKGLLDLPMPDMTDLIDDITLIESFECSNSSNEIRDPRLKKNDAPLERDKRPNKIESCSQSNQNSYQLPSFEAKPQERFSSARSPIGSKPLPIQPNEHRLDEKPLKASLLSSDSNNCSNKFSKEAKYIRSKACRRSNLDSNARFQAYNPPVPKSYAEYKRMKQKELKLAGWQPAPRKSVQKFCDDNTSENSKSLSDKNGVKPSAIKPVKNCPSVLGNRNPRSNFSLKNLKLYCHRKKNSQKTKNAGISQVDENSEDKKRREDERQRIAEEKRRVEESEEIKSPLDSLYHNENKPKTGRGYGIQNFKIPKKGNTPIFQSGAKQKETEKKGVKKKKKEGFVEEAKDENCEKIDPQTEVSSSQNELDSLKTIISKGVATGTVDEPQEEKIKATLTSTDSKEDQKETDIALVKVTHKSPSSENKDICKKVTIGENQKAEDKIDFQTVLDSKTDDQPQSGFWSKIHSDSNGLNACESIKTVKNDVGEEAVEKVQSKSVETEPVKKFELEVVECDSSVENPTLNEAITQEFVEALIRKSFESGQGKLLLAQAKLFEELGRKLNSKKLKTIQKIINSETDSSSSSSESFFCNEKKKSKSKKGKKPKKKEKKSRKPVMSSSCTSSSSLSESEESDEERNSKKRKPDSPEMPDKVNEIIASEESETKTSDVAINSKSKKKRLLDYPGCLNRKQIRHKQRQDKLIKKILNEVPIKPEETPAKEPEPKTKPKHKTKATELDRLHEDIKNMFISSGVVTATGQRMCRILKKAGGKMENLDIVKESAKMVEEEKLKKAHTSSRNARPLSTTRQNSRSRSTSLDKFQDRSSLTGRTENDYDQDPKLKSKPYVILQKVDLNNFGYGVKISEDCISFCRVRGRNTAIRGFKTFCKSFTNEKTDRPAKELAKGIFLARNKRKYERLNGKICKASCYTKKKLLDIVRNLPLKMAKIKHLQFSERKNEDARKKKIVPEKLDRKMARLGETVQFSDEDLMNHAFELRKTSYRCKVCLQNFKNITEHYKTAHPEHEVLISRLCQKEAIRAKADAEKNNYEGEQNACKESLKRNTKAGVKGPFSYHCRMCSSTRTNDVNVFFTHVTTHTGEVRFQCPDEDCNLQTANGEEIKFHILTKHPKRRYDLYNKIIELYPSPIEGCQLFGFLCSKCNFVQLSRASIETHISKQHPSDGNVRILKINMSSDTSNRSKMKRKVIKNSAKNPEKFSRCQPNRKKSEESTGSETVSLVNADFQVNTDVDKPQQQEPVAAEDKNEREDAASTTSPKMSEVIIAETDKNAEASEVVETVPSEISVVEESVVAGNAPEVQKRKNSVGKIDKVIESLEVGPIKSFLLENSEVYYNCCVQNCGHFINDFEKFAQHLTENHAVNKWDGMCRICPKKIANDLLPALDHLKFHLTTNNSTKLTEEVKQNKIEILSQKVPISADVFRRIQKGYEEVKNVEKVGVPYPLKPLLKVRNLQGDRLSTPKESVTENEVIKIMEEAVQPLQTDKMFTIENVRSLKSMISPGVIANNPEQICGVKEQHPAGSQVGPGKVILVRSCPTRKITIRPENKTVGQFNLVQTPVPAHPHPVMLNPIPTGTPIHLLSPLQPVGQNSRIALKPVIVTSSATFKGNSTMIPIVRPAITSATLLPVIPASDSSEVAHKSNLTEEQNKSVVITSECPLEITVSLPSKEPKTPMTKAAPKVISEFSNLEEQGEKGLVNPLRIFTSIGSKIVKDTGIYKQMLTKAKLCHLFKCMAVECSFTCNSENVFTRHIGLHEVQRRLKKKKDLKGGLEIVKKSRKTFQWQQCAYCCQILNYTDSSLSRHVVIEHGHCTYQCAFCFYRAVSQNYVEIHQNLVHSQILKTNSRVIYKCKPLGAFASRPSSLERRGKKQSVRPYICDQCGKNFYVVQEFLTHLTTEHQTVTAYTCHICKNISFKANRLINHYKLHSYCTYQCAYCLHGTETDVEMVFHLCNFHFSQPAVMYLRALPEGVEPKGITPLESMKVVVYENDSLNEDCIIEVDQEAQEDSTFDPLKESVDFSEIVAELGINSNERLEYEVTPLLKELASLSDQNAKNVTVKALLPNAQFSSENDNINEGCSVLISSGVSLASCQNDDKEMSIPLGQLPLEALNIKRVQHSSSLKNVEPPKKSPTLKETENKLKARDMCQSSVNKEDEKTVEPFHIPCVHNLPQVLLTRTLGPKNVYPARRLTSAKKPSENPSQAEGKVPAENSPASCENKGSESEQVHFSKNKPDNGQKVASKRDSSEKDPDPVTQPLITSVVSLSKSGFVNGGPKSTSGVGVSNVSASQTVINVRSDVSFVIPTNAPVRGVENFQSEDNSLSLDANTKKAEEKGSAEDEYPGPKSPDIVIIKEAKSSKAIETVTLDSDDEKDSGNSKSKMEHNSKKATEESYSNGEIRKEMEILRQKITEETNSLLFYDSKEKKSLTDLTVTLTENQDLCKRKDFLSPIEEAICSLNRKLESETAKAKGKEQKPHVKAEDNNFDESKPVKPRTRFGFRERKKECAEEKNTEEDGKKEESWKNKKFEQELVGKGLYICGNEQCTFAAENSSLLKDHLYVCDFSRLSSVLMCPHCWKHFKQFAPYLEHLKYHGEKKFHCGLCSFSSAVENATVRHVKQKHKCNILKSVLKEPPKEEHVVFYPKNYKIEKIDFEENGYSPGDEDKLPLQSVYQINVKCAKCPYFTKVRSNMVRHLKIHVKSAETEGVIVPSTAPTNPVPCLETKEKMFDKMTNLAASSQLAQAEKEKITALPPELEAKYPQFVAEQLRFKCCLSDCNYLTVDDRVLKHHIKALHNEVTHYSCPHCRSTVNIDIRNVPLERVGHHLKFHDSRLYKCGYCIYIHYQKSLVEKHLCEKHPDRRCFVQTVRDVGLVSEEEHSGSEADATVWKCARCQDFQSLSKAKLKDHLLNDHKIRSSYQCKHCPMTGNTLKMFTSHFASKHPGEKVAYTPLFYEQKVPCSKLGSLSGSSSGADSSNEHFDTTPLWQRGVPRIRHIRGILIEEEEVKSKKIKRWSVEEAEAVEPVSPRNKAFYCPLCTDKKKVFFTKSEYCFRTHLYQELNYQQFACILCGKMFVNKKDFDRHHSRMHPDKPPEVNQTKEDTEIIYWVDQVIAKQREQMTNENKRKLSESESSEGPSPPKKKKEES